MLLRYQYIVLVCVAMTLAGFFMLRVMRFCIQVILPEMLPVFERQNSVGQVLLLLMECFVIRLCNMIRLHIVKTSIFTPNLRSVNDLLFLAYFATVLWLISMGYLSWQLWSLHASGQFWMIVQLLFINTGIGIMMGITLPYCTMRNWLYLQRKRRNKH